MRKRETNKINKKAKKFKLWLEFKIWEPKADDDIENDFFNMQIELDTGETYALNVWTFKYLQTALEEQKQERGVLGTKYMVTPDLLVEKMDRDLLIEIVNDLIINNELKEEWIIPD